MASPEPEDFARVALVPYSWVELLAGITADVETADLTIERNWKNNTFTIRVTRDSKVVSFTVKAEVFKEFVARVRDLCGTTND